MSKKKKVKNDCIIKPSQSRSMTTMSMIMFIAQSILKAHPLHHLIVMLYHPHLLHFSLHSNTSNSINEVTRRTKSHPLTQQEKRNLKTCIRTLLVHDKTLHSISTTAFSDVSKLISKQLRAGAQRNKKEKRDAINNASNSNHHHKNSISNSKIYIKPVHIRMFLRHNLIQHWVASSKDSGNSTLLRP